MCPVFPTPGSAPVYIIELVPIYIVNGPISGSCMINYNIIVIKYSLFWLRNKIVKSKSLGGLIPVQH